MDISTKKGSPKPFGASITPEGVNFAIYSKHATHAVLCLFDYESKNAVSEIPLDPTQNRTGDVWHVLVKGLPDKVLYAYRLAKKKGRIFCQFYQEDNLILDPYAKFVESRKLWGDRNEKYQAFGGFTTEEEFDWERDAPLKHPIEDLVFYEMHVRGFTQDRSSDVSQPGTFTGIIEKIPYLRELGINAVKLLPIQEFNECEYTRQNPFTNEPLLNYWGYSTVNFFSPMTRFSSGSYIKEFKTLVKELHKNGIEVILDIVFNHTAEGGIGGNLYSFKGIDPSVYYILDKKENHVNYTGCGNTVNCNHPIVRELILNCLQYWVTEMHVDGFRFDLAAIMTRGLQGEPLENPPLIEELSQDPILADTKLIAEPWDLGLYQQGRFYPKQERWSEWNDQYRDTTRKFIKGDKGAKREFAKRICGSEDIFYSRSPRSSVNFITAHDGFTLRDLVSYNDKHNINNGENNQDGSSANYSWNCGQEGDTDRPEILALREKQMRNFHLALMISQGVPMVQMGDEYGHTRQGNNNSWCQDNTLNWFLWDQLEDKKENFFRFYKGLIHFRRKHEIFRMGRFLTDKDIQWHGPRLGQPDWDGDSQSLAFVLRNKKESFYIAFNTQGSSLVFDLPLPDFSQQWSLLANTGAPSPRDFHFEESAPLYLESWIELEAYSAVILFSKI